MVKRPLGTIGFSWFLSLEVAYFLPLSPVGKGVLAAGLTVAGLLLALSARRRALPAVLICLAAAAAVAANAWVCAARVEPVGQLAGQLGETVLEVTQSPRQTGGVTRFVARVESTTAEGAPDFPFLAEVGVWGTADLQVGDRAVCTARFTRPDRPAGGWDNLTPRGIYLSAELLSEEHLLFLEHRESPAAALERWRKRLASSVQRQLPSQAGELVAAMSWGERAALSEGVREDFQTAGVAHLLALSGLHLGLCAAMGAGLVRMLGGSKRGAVLAGAALALVYGALVGFSPSICRAVVLCCYGAGAFLCRRTVDGPTAMGVCGLVLTLGNPLAVADLRLLLSFGSTCALVLALPRVRRAVGERGPLATSICQTGVVLCCTGPLLALSFGELSLLAFAGNLLCLPLAGPTVLGGALCGLLGLLPGPWGQALGYPFAVLAGLCARAMAAAAHLLARWDWLVIPLEGPGVWYGLGAACLWGAACLQLPERFHRLRWLAAGAALCALGGWLLAG
ncbi:ComEC/Rec2 family competence protein [Bittarella massiliensis]|nr:ComEC/Rec2 family competence protein [Bittarella massiliensis (ex Durand et al. 2017)]MBO1678478.1 ComEC/Rec2 family competence protein [Bittarella massiliensis (ex Durand et al. 2017)]